MSLTLNRLIAREVLDSRGRPTIEVEAITAGGVVGVAIVPSGASTGRHEAVELRDQDDTRHDGLGVRGAVAHVVDVIAPALIGIAIDDQADIDARLIALDGTPAKSRLGANAILGVSLACAHAAAAARRLPLFAYLHQLWRESLAAEAVETAPTLPMPMVNLISGGLHAGRQLDLQDFLMIPIGVRSYSEALEMSAGVYHRLRRVLRAHGEEGFLVADEGGYGPRLASHRAALDRIIEAAAALGYEPGIDIALAIDVAATHLLDSADGRYRLRAEGDLRLDALAMAELLGEWADRYPIVSLEDPLAEDDWDGWTTLTASLGPRLQVIGDDLFATQAARLQQGIDRHAANAILVKVNQVGTLSETFETLRLARRHGYRTIISARSGETEDTTIADLAVATGAGQIKIGAVARSERLAKYNRLLRIEEALGGPGAARFAGWPTSAR